MSSSMSEAKLIPHSTLPTTSFSRLTIPYFATRTSPVDGKGGMRLPKNSDSTRSQPKLNDKGKDPVRGDNTLSPFGKDTSHYNGATYSSYERPLTSEGFANGRSKLRGSFVTASDALSFKFGRRKPSIREPPKPFILPGVIEISAQRRDEEVEERNRLREMAAQAIGLGPFMVSQGSESHGESTANEEDEDRLAASLLGYQRNSESALNISASSPHNSSFSETMPVQPSAGRLRSGSTLANTMTAITPIPSFPSTVSALTLFRQSSGAYPKYYPPSSLRIFALSKNWKSRFLILSSPATVATRGQTPAVSYLHLFKSSTPEEKELERLEINEGSVVFVAEEEVGGRRQVIKIGGADVGAMKKEYIHEEGGYIMWFLQITDQAEAQQWITNIKNAILGQRTVRAGLIPAYTLGNNEPRGDMDVMLSIRAQALVTSPNSKPRSTHSASQNTSQDRYYASSTSSHSATSQRTGQKAAGGNGPVSALKGLFSNRPRSASGAISVDFERQQEREVNNESFTNVKSLLGKLRPKTPDRHSVTAPVVVIASPPLSDPVDPIDRCIDRKILTEQQPVQWTTADQSPVNKDRANRSLSLGALSLQPPPRKRWTSTRPTSDFSTPDLPGVGKKPNDIVVQVNDLSVSGPRLSMDRAETEVPCTPNQLFAFDFGAPEQKSRAPSLRSVSTVNSGDLAFGIERSSSSTKRSSGPGRWSRQGILPNRLTPPSEPPPAIPGDHLTPGLHPYTAERTPSPTPSRSSQKSVVSTLPSFSKRASVSSARSVNSYDAARYSISTGASSSTNGAISIRSTASHRASMPPPRPPPTVALPPAPIQEPQDTLSPSEAPSKSSFRNSVAQRAFRLSTTAPKPPPSTNLPPRPDEPELKTHRRSSNSNHSIHGHSTQLESIPGSPTSTSKSISPFPPPDGPLPPTPHIALLPSLQIPPVKRPPSIKQRLRMLSAPSPSAGQLEKNIPDPSQQSTIEVASPNFMTPPSTPIGEKITLFQNDPSFLQMHTPTLPFQSPNLSLFSPPPEENAGITSLSPPPRRGSKQLLETELEGPRRIAVPNETLLTVGGEPRHLSLSRPGSMISINVSACWQETDSESSPVDATHPTDELPLEVEELQEELSKDKPTLETRHLSLSRPGSVLSLGIMSL